MLKKIVVLVLVLCALTMSLSVVSAADDEYNYWFDFPDEIEYSYRSASVARIKTASGSAYVKQNGSSISTYYYMLLAPTSTPIGSSGTMAANRLNISSSGTYYFTWKSGYGGLNTGYYYLAATPNPDITHDEYVTSGKWRP